MISSYYEFFPELPFHEDDEVTMDEFVAEAMRTDLRFPTLAEELHYQRSARITLKNELLTCYQYLKDKGLLDQYHAYRDGEELPLEFSDDIPFD